MYVATCKGVGGDAYVDGLFCAVEIDCYQDGFVGILSQESVLPVGVEGRIGQVGIHQVVKQSF
ncbi:hypothetical protein Barb7_01629 [Bacteroidales bacterium Barb7]|nr:hypothetical protein Barb7_01629 [Bacteroidales bacterium Barb7]